VIIPQTKEKEYVGSLQTINVANRVVSVDVGKVSAWCVQKTKA